MKPITDTLAALTQAMTTLTQNMSDMKSDIDDIKMDQRNRYLLERRYPSALLSTSYSKSILSVPAQNSTLLSIRN